MHVRARCALCGRSFEMPRDGGTPPRTCGRCRHWQKVGGGRRASADL
ncbi:hypothetical protein Ae717Ps2_5927c [Pseudonocardia sp. Ae717_Ps2]|nr:hypothetical protein Ae717Ps2_5882c [Pseudonocardia sp. Ae717_Ps2]OLM29003.1 hypothetical protein Ae717Ps2_5927c [Pseudonocardia sp. Ae717_Ps2]